VKKLALALCLAATLTACETPLSSAAAAAQVAPRLPNTVLGHYWCFSRAPDDDPWLISSADNFDDCANRGGARFWRRGGATKKYECQVTEVVEDISTEPKTLAPEYDLVLIEVARNPPSMKVSHIDKKGKVAERNKQYRNGSYVLLSTDDTTGKEKEMASPVLTLYGSRTVGSTIYRMVGKMTFDYEGPLYYGYYEEIYKDGSVDATIKAGNCSERK
jgi:hypothetical protein